MMKRNCGTDSHKSPQARIADVLSSSWSDEGFRLGHGSRLPPLCFLSHGYADWPLLVGSSIHYLSRSSATTTTTSVTYGPVASSCTSS